MHGQPEDISAVLEYSNHDVLQVLESKLATMAHKRVVLEESIDSPSLEGGNNTGLSQRRSLCELHCLEHALYIASNIATGLDAHKVSRAKQGTRAGVANTNFSNQPDLWRMTQQRVPQFSPIKIWRGRQRGRRYCGQLNQVTPARGLEPVHSRFE